MDIIEKVKSAIKQRNNFSLSYDSVLTADFGDFVPIVCKEMVPTDNFTVQSQVFVRLAPLAVPTYGRIHGYINSFYVPNRILMPENEWNDSITGGINGDYPETFPFITLNGLLYISNRLSSVYGAEYKKRFQKMLSYLGLGDIIGDLEASAISATEMSQRAISLLPLLALLRIYYDYYAPVGFDPSADISLREAYTTKYKGFVTDTTNLDRITYALANMSVCYNKDYFTTAQTRPQRGSASLAPIDIAGSDFNPNLGQSVSGSPLSVTKASDGVGLSSTSTPSRSNVLGQVSSHVLHWAEKVQQFLERNNIAGGRAFEQMLARFGVKLTNEQLQRSQYLGGNDMWIQVSDVTSTSDTSTASLGEMAGKGIGLGRKTIKCSADEYGFFISIFHFVPETGGLVDGMDKMWRRIDKFDYWQPELEATGFEPIKMYQLNRHFYTAVPDGGTRSKDSVFGYVPRDADYKFANPILAGDFVLGSAGYSDALMSSYNLYRRIGENDVLDGSLDYIDNPVLGYDFLELVGVDGGQNNFNRIFQNTSSEFDHFFINCQIAIGANRPMIGYAESGLEFTEDEKGNIKYSLPYGGMRL